MIVIVLERTSRRLRGELTHWLLEVKAGVFVGHVNALVRDKLWEKCCTEVKAGWGFIAWTTNSEQKFSMDLCGDSNRRIVDLEGIQLIEEAGSYLTDVQARRIKKVDV